MRISTIHRVTVGQMLAALLSLLMCQQSFGQRPEQAKPPDKSIEAAGYLAQADRELACAPESAKNWAKKALDTLGSARDRDAIVRDTLGDLKSQSNLKIAAADKQITALTAGAKAARSSIKQARLVSAAEALKAADPQACYAGFKELLAEIGEHERQAAGYVRQGDDILPTKPKSAIKLYEAAAKINSEHPDIQNKRAAAVEAERVRPKKHTARNWTILLLVLAGIGVGVYYGCKDGGCQQKGY